MKRQLSKCWEHTAVTSRSEFGSKTHMHCQYGMRQFLLAAGLPTTALTGLSICGAMQQLLCMRAASNRQAYWWVAFGHQSTSDPKHTSRLACWHGTAVGTFWKEVQVDHCGIMQGLVQQITTIDGDIAQPGCNQTPQQLACRMRPCCITVRPRQAMGSVNRAISSEQTCLY